MMDMAPLKSLPGIGIASQTKEGLVVVVDDQKVEFLLEKVELTGRVQLERALSRLLLRSGESRGGLLVAPHISRDDAHALEDFVSEYAPGRAWGFLDEVGNAHLVIPSLDFDQKRRIENSMAMSARRPIATARPNLTEVRNQSLFTDLNEWLLKVMLLNRAPSKFWDRPRLEIRTPVALSKIDWIDVSQGKAYQFAHTLKEMGYVVWRRGVFELVDVDRLLDAWLSDARNRRPHRIAVRSVLGDSLGELFGAAESAPAHAFAGAFAAESYGMRHVSGGVPEVYVWDPFDQVIDKLMLDVCADSEAEFYLVHPGRRESVRRGLQVIEGRPCVDIIQTALDAVRRPARGLEQAEYTVGEVLRWIEP